MKLHYFHGRGPLRSLVLMRQQRRVELHVKKVDAEIWSLVVMAGSAGGQPDTTRCQGPYRSIERAESVLRGVAGALLGEGYEPRPEETSVWAVGAQRLARDIRRQADANAGRYVFDPDQYEPTI